MPDKNSWLVSYLCHTSISSFKTADYWWRNIAAFVVAAVIAVGIYDLAIEYFLFEAGIPARFVTYERQHVPVGMRLHCFRFDQWFVAVSAGHGAGFCL